MKRILPSVFLALLLPVPAFADVDVLSAGGSVYLAWTEGAQSHVAIEGTSTERTFGLPRITIGEVGPAFDHLVVALNGADGNPPDSLIILDPGDLSTEMSRNLELDDLLWPGVGTASVLSIRVARHNDYDSGIHLHATALSLGVQWCIYAVSARFVPDPVLGLTLDTSFYVGGWNPYCEYDSGTRPVHCAAQDPTTQFFRMTCAMHSPYTYSIYATVHQPDDGSRAEPSDYTVLGSFIQPEIPSLKAAGSCQDAILLLWTVTGSAGCLCSVFDGTTSVPNSSGELGFPLDPDQPCAMSCNRDDPGLLLAWLDGGELWVRYYGDGWNPASYEVASGIGAVSDGDLAVCSDDQGYWIAWLEDGKSEPELRFVPRDSVTGITAGDPAGPGSLSLVPLSNPLRGIPVLDIGGCASADLAVYDVSGREVFSAMDREGPTPIELPGAGIYFAVVSRGSARASARFTFVD